MSSSRSALLAIAALLFAGGLLLGATPVHTDNVSCGSVLFGGGNAKEEDFTETLSGTLVGGTPDDDETNYQDACSTAKGDRKPLAYGGLGLGAIALIASFLVAQRAPERTDPDFRPSA